MPPLRAAAALLLALSPAAARAATPPALVAAVHNFVTAASGKNRAAFTALFVPDASITDTLKPYHWQGPGTAARYFDDLQTALTAVAWTNFRVEPNGSPFVVAGQNVGYASIPVLIDYTAKGTPHKDPGTFTLSLKSDGAAWLITSATWTYTKPPSP